ncbi:hypothetical protein J2129_002457 [Methanofollis sp. W23]|nr:hypothetical protein [Methanofollis sp. W23]
MTPHQDRGECGNEAVFPSGVLLRRGSRDPLTPENSNKFHPICPSPRVHA